MKPSIEYFAGVFDGEGFVRIDDHFHQINTGNIRYALHAGVAMTYKPLIKMFFDKWGGMYKGDKSFQERYAKNRIIYRWSIGNLNCERFLLEIRDHVIVKKEQVEIAIEFQRHVTANKRWMVGQGFKDPKDQAKRLAIQCTNLLR